MTAHRHHKRASFVDPRSLVFWVLVGLLVYGAIHFYPLILSAVTTAPTATTLSGVLWGLYGLVLAVIIYRLELFERRSPVTMLGAFLWGFFAVSGIAAVAAHPMHELFGKILGSDLEAWVPAFAAPLVEEPLKMLGVVALAFIPGARINSVLDGLFFGLLVGLGFEVGESFLFGANAAANGNDVVTAVIMSFVLRGIVGGLWNHPTYTAITGAGVGYFFSSKESAFKRWSVMLGALVVAMVLHGFFDSPLFESGNVLVATVVKGLPVFILLLVLVRIARNRERSVFGSVAEGQVPDDLVSSDELETLLTRRSRKQSRKALKKQHGLAAAHAMKRLQRSQVELVSAVGTYGPSSDISQALVDDVQEDRQVLQQVTSVT